MQKGVILLHKSKIFYGGVFLEKEDLLESNINYEVELEYYKTEKNKSNKSSKIYGIEIIRKDYITEDITSENSIMEYITEDEEKLNNILEIIKRNKVFPKDLEYLVKDLLKVY